MKKYFVALDIGSFEIAAVGAHWVKNGEYIIEGFCRTKSKGFSRGIVTDVTLATNSIQHALNKLREKTDKKFHEIYAGISSTSIGVTQSSGMLLLSKYGREISESDIRRCVEMGGTIKMPLDREPLHKIIRGFSIDDEKIIKNPINLEAVKLKVDMNIVTINSSTLNNMSKCISQAGFIPAGYIFSGVASSYRTLEKEDKMSGAALLEVGGELTEAVIFSNGTLENCKVFSIGIENIMTENSVIDIALLEKLSQNIKSMDGWGKVKKAVVVGHGFLVDNLIESLESLLSIQIHSGTCSGRPFEELPPDRAGYIGSLGILDYLYEEKQKERLEGNIIKKGLRKARIFIDEYF